MASGDQGVPRSSTDRDRVDLAKLRPGDRTPSGAVRWQPAAPTPPAAPRRRRPLVLVAVGVVVVLLALTGVGVVVLGSDGGGEPDGRGTASAQSTSATAPTTATSAPLSATDRVLLTIEVGNCLAMENLLDDTTDPDAQVVACDDSRATFSVASVSRKVRARTPCTTDTFIRSPGSGRVVCINRVLAAGQCVLGNGVDQFLVSAVACATRPEPPFTQVLRIEEYRQGGTPVMCTAQLVLVTATPDRSMCLRDVTPT